jgi:hypothetical protein
MNQWKAALHESGHAVIAHYSGAKIIKLSINKDFTSGEAEFKLVDFKKDLTEENIDRKLTNYYCICIMIHVAGFLAEYLHFGELFWILNPSKLLMSSFDMQEIYRLNEKLKSLPAKEETHKLFCGLQVFLSTPRIWGKVHGLADELQDSPEGLNDIGLLIGQCRRERKPENNALPLIDFIVDNLYEGKQ